MSATLAPVSAAASMFPHRFRSLMTLLALTVVGSVISSAWLLPSRLERIAVGLEQGDQSLVERELDTATHRPIDPGEARALVDVALTMGAPETAAAILEQFLATQPDSIEGLRLLTEVQRQRHETLNVAALDERLYALTGDAEALRESADIYASRHMAAERLGALRRLAAIGRATSSDMAELTRRVVQSGDRGEALSSLMQWLRARGTGALPVELLGLAAGLSAETADASAIAEQLGALVGRRGEIGPLHVLIQTYAERGHSRLSLVAGRALGPAMTGRPEVALTLAQLEALQGDFAGARARLEQLDRTGTLLPAGLPMLADLSIQSGALDRAATIMTSLAAEQISEGLPHRLIEAAVAAGRTDLLAGLPLDAIARSSPASAASIALARGDRLRAISLAASALAPDADLTDVGPAFTRVIHALGREHDAIVRLLGLVRAGVLSDEALSLLLDLAPAAGPDAPALLDALRAQRDRDPRAGLTWAMLAARSGRSAAVADWLQGAGAAVPTPTLLDLLLLAADRNEVQLAGVAAAALSTRTDLPTGWTVDEIALTAAARKPLTPARLKHALDLVARPAIDNPARDRIAALLTGAPGFAQAALTVGFADSPAVTWLMAEIPADRSAGPTAVRLELLAALAPQQALGFLADEVDADRRRLLPLYLASLSRAGRAAEAQARLRSAMKSSSPDQQNALLSDLLARLPPSDHLSVLRIGATTGRADWVSAYEEKLVRLGMLDELRAALHAEAAAEHDPARLQALASRLVDLRDRSGAIAALKTVAAGKAPASPEVEQLMFLWGPRGAADAVEWTRDQALAASSERLPKWIEHLAYLGKPEAVISVVEHRPAALATSARVVQAYGAALIAAHARSTPDLRSAIASNPSPEILVALAQLALDTSQPGSAWQAAQTALTAAPRDPGTLLLAAEAAAAARRSADAATLYTRLLALGPQPVSVCVDAADALITAKRPAEARKILEASFTRQTEAPKTISAVRLRARSLMLLARDDEAAALLTEWLARFPDHAGLRADLLQARLDRK